MRSTCSAPLTARREASVGNWPVEPALDAPYEDPLRATELADAVTAACELLLERLSSLERAVFVLREVFAFGFPEIAATVGRSESACRQLAVRARRHMSSGGKRFSATRREREKLARRLMDAVRNGNVEPLRRGLASDIALTVDRKLVDAGARG